MATLVGEVCGHWQLTSTSTVPGRYVVDYIAEVVHIGQHGALRDGPTGLQGEGAVFEGYRTLLAPLRTLLEAINMALYPP